MTLDPDSTRPTPRNTPGETTVPTPRQPIAPPPGRPPGNNKSDASGGKGQLNLLVWGLSIALGIAILLNGGVVFALARDLSARWSGTGLNPFQASGDTGPQGLLAPGAPTPTLSLDVTPQPWNGTSRVTVLVMGLDFRDWIAGSGAPRSDTMMLLTIDPVTKTAGMLSVPRDLWVEIPGFGHQRINTAYASGEGNRLPGGGPGLAIRTVEEVIGVPIDYYAVIDFASFERMIDEIGGIDVLVRQRIKIAPIGRLARWLDAKPYHLDGPDALAYARVRKAAGGDFGRAERQQQVALAIIDQILNFNQLPSLVAKAPGLYQELSSGVRTNMTLQEMVSLGVLALQIPKRDIRSGVIAPPNMVGFHTTETGAQVLRPVPDQIRILRDEIFVNSSAIVSPP